MGFAVRGGHCCPPCPTFRELDFDNLRPSVPRPFGRGAVALALRATHRSRLSCFFGLDRDRCSNRAGEYAGSPREVVPDGFGLYLDVRSGLIVVLPFPDAELADDEDAVALVPGLRSMGRKLAERGDRVPVRFSVNPLLGGSIEPALC